MKQRKQINENFISLFHFVCRRLILARCGGVFRARELILAPYLNVNVCRNVFMLAGFVILQLSLSRLKVPATA